MDQPQLNKTGRRIVEKPYAVWTYEERVVLLITRIRLDFLFTSKNSNMSTAWRRVFNECSGKLGPGKTFTNCRHQWTGLMKKYKSFFLKNSGDGNGDDAPQGKEDRECWPYFEIIHKYASNKDNYHPPYLISSSEGVIASKEPALATDSDISMTEPCSPVPPSTSPVPSTSNTESISRTSSCSSTPSTSHLSERPTSKMTHERYLAQREQRDCRLEKKINGMLGVFGQMVKYDYPNINVDALLISTGSDDSD